MPCLRPTHRAIPQRPTQSKARTLIYTTTCIERTCQPSLPSPPRPKAPGSANPSGSASLATHGQRGANKGIQPGVEGRGKNASTRKFGENAEEWLPDMELNHD